MARDFGGDGSPLRVFGAMLRFYRTQAGMTQDQLAASAYCSGDLVGKVENGNARPPGSSLPRATPCPR
jgi:transcriptional regulator with XRE-family HTH domain